MHRQARKKHVKSTHGESPLVMCNIQRIDAYTSVVIAEPVASMRSNFATLLAKGSGNKPRSVHLTDEGDAVIDMHSAVLIAQKVPAQ